VIPHTILDSIDTIADMIDSIDTSGTTHDVR
jgi:hypothetical protein